MKRAIILLLDSFGIGAAADADAFDSQADTFGHIVEACASGRADKAGVRSGALQIPTLEKLGLYHAARMSTGKTFTGIDYNAQSIASFGYAVETSYGKDTPSGHWEIAGVPALFHWGYFTAHDNCFPPELLNAFIRETGVPGILGNKHASGTEIINELGDEHFKTRKPIVYTSADSVFQIACHESIYPPEQLYKLCEITRRLVDEYNIGRVIARPFLGANGNYYRTANRRDYAIPPPSATLLEQLIAQQGYVIGVGKTADIFAHKGFSEDLHADGNIALFEVTLAALKRAQDKTLIFSNLVDFDSKYGHRRDVMGYAHALEELDQRLPELLQLMRDDDVLIITADHGCDPTLPGSDHTREHIPVLMYSPSIAPRSLGGRASFADIGQSLASYLGIKPLAHGESFV